MPSPSNDKLSKPITATAIKDTLITSPPITSTAIKDTLITSPPITSTAIKDTLITSPPYYQHTYISAKLLA
jgi:hypothetical protein